MTAAVLPRRLIRRVTAIALVGAMAVSVQALALLSDSESVPGNTFATSACFTARVRSVQTGEITSAGDGASTAVIAAVDPDRAFVLHSLRSAGGDPADELVLVELTDATTVTVTRSTDAVVPTDIVVRWSVVEYACGVSVQRGTTAGGGAATLDVAIDPVDLAQSFPLVSVAPPATASGAGAADHVATALPNSTTLRLSSGGALGASTTYAWQVVEFTSPGDARVQRVTATLGVGTAQASAVIPTPVDPGRTFVLAAGTGAAPLSGLALRASLSDATTVTFDRSTTTQAVAASAWVVELSDGSTVQRGQVTLVPGDATEDATINAVDTATTTVLSSSVGAGGQAYGESDVAGSDRGTFQATFALAGPTTVRLTRTTTGATSSFVYQAVQWGGPRWWDAAYGARLQLFVEGAGASAPAGYTTSIAFDHAALVAAGTGLASGDDLRIARWDGTAWVELDRVLADGSAWGAADTTVWFKTVDGVSASGSDGTYWLYSGNVAAAGPPVDENAVWLFADSFEDGDLAEYTDQPMPWYSADPWTYRRALTIAAGTVGSNLTDFPVLVQYTDAGLVGVARSDGGDLRFTAANGTTILDHELVSFTPASGAVEAYVRVPTVSAAASTTIYLYAGAANAPSQQDVHGTWSNGFVGVWHLGEDPDVDEVLTDSSPQDLDALAVPANTGGAAGGIAVQGGGVGGDVGPNLAPRAALTVSAVVTASTPGTVVARGTAPDWSLGLWLDGATQRPTATIAAGLYPVTVTGGVAGAGQHIAARYDGARLDTLVSGSVTATAAATGAVNATAGADVTFGAFPDGSDGIDGVIGEIRVADVGRTDAWLAAEAASLTSPGTFVTVGSAASGTWFDVGDWGQRIPVTIDATAITGSLTDVAFLLEGTDAAMAVAAQASGADIVVTGDDGVTRLPHELESYSSGTGAFRLWVLVPSLAATADEVVYVYFDNATARDQQDAAAVFAGADGVYHLDDDPSVP